MKIFNHYTPPGITESEMATNAIVSCCQEVPKPIKDSTDDETTHA